METKANKPISPLMWVTAIALIVFSGVGIAAFMGWLPASIGNPNNHADAAVATAKAPVIAAKPHTAGNSPARICAECGVIESIQEFNNSGEGSGLGAVGGAVVGGVLGHQVGGGRGKDLATVAGAVGGAVAGNEIEKQVKSTKSYEVTVRFDDGTRRVFSESNPPAWRPGDRIKVVNGVIQSNG